MTSRTADQLVSAAVEQLRADRGLTVDQLAVYAGINRASMFRKLKNEAKWFVADVEALARYFGVPVSDLFSGKPVGVKSRRKSDS